MHMVRIRSILTSTLALVSLLRVQVDVVRKDVCSFISPFPSSMLLGEEVVHPSVLPLRQKHIQG